VVFDDSLEEVSTFFPSKTMWRSFFAAVVAAAFLQFIDPLQDGKLAIFAISYDTKWSVLHFLLRRRYRAWRSTDNLSVGPLFHAHVNACACLNEQALVGDDPFHDVGHAWRIDRRILHSELQAMERLQKDFQNPKLPHHRGE